MSDLHLVVQLDAVVDQCVLDGATVDRRIGADLDVVAEAHAADVGNLHVAVGVGREAESIAPDDRTRLEHATRADRDVTADGDSRLQPAIVAEARAILDHAVRADGAALADHDVRTDDGVRADPGGRSDRRRRRNVRAACPSCRNRGERIQAGRDPRITCIGLRADERSDRAVGRQLARQDDRSRPRRRKLLAVFRPGAERELAGRRGGKRRHAVDRLAGVAGELQSVADSDLAERNRHRGAPCQRSWLRAWAVVSRLPAPWT